MRAHARVFDPAHRAGIEGSLSFLNRKFGLKRSMFRGDAGTGIWVGWCVVAANLYRFGRPRGPRDAPTLILDA